MGHPLAVSASDENNGLWSDRSLTGQRTTGRSRKASSDASSGYGRSRNDNSSPARMDRRLHGQETWEFSAFPVAPLPLAGGHTMHSVIASDPFGNRLKSSEMSSWFHHPSNPVFRVGHAASWGGGTGFIQSGGSGRMLRDFLFFFSFLLARDGTGIKEPQMTQNCRAWLCMGNLGMWHHKHQTELVPRALALNQVNQSLAWLAESQLEAQDLLNTTWEIPVPQPHNQPSNQKQCLYIPLLHMD